MQCVCNITVFLQAFNFDIRYRRSEEHETRRFFSVAQEKRKGEYDIIDVFQIENVDTLPVTARIIREETDKDATLAKIRQALQKGKSLTVLGYNMGYKMGSSHYKGI